MGLCPFHDDHEPSLVISPEKNLWHCLGACQAGGTVIDWVMRAEGVSFRHAVELLRADLPTLDAAPPRGGGRRTGPVVKHSTVRKLAAPLERTASDDVLLRQVVDFYHAALKESPVALEYLQKRGLNSAEMIEHFRLGFSNRTLGYRLPHKNRQAGAELRGQLQRVGILRESGHEHFTGSLVIPVFDAEGRVTEMYGRKLNDHLRPGTPYHLYLPGAHRGVWNEAALASTKEVILCEALIDALTFWCAGFRNVTASYGVEGFTDDHRAAFRKYGVERVYIAYDRDEAGDRAAEKLGQELAGMGIEVMRVKFPKGMDANEYALKVQPTAQSLGLVLRKAEWMAGVRREGEETVVHHGPVASVELNASAAATPVAEHAWEPEVIPSLAAEPAATDAESEADSISERAREEASSLMASEALTASGTLKSQSTPPVAPEPARRMSGRGPPRAHLQVQASFAQTVPASPPPRPALAPNPDPKWIRLADLQPNSAGLDPLQGGSAWPISAGSAWPISTGSASPIQRGSHTPIRDTQPARRSRSARRLA